MLNGKRHPQFRRVNMWIIANAVTMSLFMGKVTPLPKPSQLWEVEQHLLKRNLFHYSHIYQDVIVSLHCCLILLRYEILKSLENFRSLARSTIKMQKLKVAKITASFWGSHTNLNQNSAFMILELIVSFDTKVRLSLSSYLFDPKGQTKSQS